MTAARGSRGAVANPRRRLPRSLTDARRSELKIEGGIAVENAQGAAARAGIRRGDIILSVNNQVVKSVEQFIQIMGQFEKGNIVALRVRRGGNSLYVPFQIDGNSR
jgi:serine protease Do